MKRVLLVSYHCPPALNAESILVWKTLRRLADWHDVTVLTADDGGVQDAALALPDGIAVMRRRTPRPPGRNAGRAADKLLGFAADERVLWALSALSADIAQGDYDVLYSRSQPGASHILAWLLKLRLGLPWVAQFSDPWTPNPYHSGHTRVRDYTDRHAERQVMIHADRLIFPTREILEMYERQYPGLQVGQRAVVLPHHIAPELYGGATDSRFDDLSEVSRERVTLSHFGDFYGLRSPEPLIRAVQSLAGGDPNLATRLRLRFVGNIQGKFLPLIEESPVEVLTGRVSYLESLRAMAHSSVLVLLDAPTDTGVNPFLPSKLIDYLGAMRPILGITETRGTAADVLREFGHPVIRPQDIAGISRQIAAWLECPPTGPARTPEAFHSARVVGELARVIEEASNAR